MDDGGKLISAEELDRVREDAAAKRADLRRGAEFLAAQGLDADLAVVITSLMMGYDLDSACYNAGISEVEFQYRVACDELALILYRNTIKVVGIKAYWLQLSVLSSVRGQELVNEGDRLIIQQCAKMAEIALPEVLGRDVLKKRRKKAVEVSERSDQSVVSRSGDDEAILVDDGMSVSEVERILGSMGDIDFKAGDLVKQSGETRKGPV